MPNWFERGICSALWCAELMQSLCSWVNPPSHKLELPAVDDVELKSAGEEVPTEEEAGSAPDEGAEPRSPGPAGPEGGGIG